MRHLCVHCDLTFDTPAGDDPRCPKCMRKHGLRAVDQPGPSSSPSRAPQANRKRGLLLVVALGVVAAGAGLYAWRAQQTEQAIEGGGELSEGDVAGALAARKLDAGALAKLLEADDAVRAFARKAASTAASPTDKAEAVTLALRARGSALAFVPWSRTDAREGPPLTAAETLRALEKDGARRKLYPLELSALGVAALRALDVDARPCEVFGASTLRAPLDPSGRLGYFALAVMGPAGESPKLFDPYGGLAEAELGEHALLTDLQAIGAALALQALGRLEANEDPALALRDAEAAVTLLPSSPSVRAARGTALLLSAAAEPGMREIEAAAQMRPDAPRKNNLAMIALAMGDAPRAMRELSQALEKSPDFALAHLTLAAAQLGTGEREQARAELDKAEALDPDLPALPLTRAELYASGGELERALAEARRAVTLKPSNPQARLLVGRLLRQAGRYDEMRAEARATLALAPPALRERTAELIKRLLGPTALEAPIDGPDSGAAPALPEPKRLSLGAAPDGPKLRLLPEAPAGSPQSGALQGAPDTPRLRLAEPGSPGLKLNAP